MAEDKDQTDQGQRQRVHRCRAERNAPRRRQGVAEAHARDQRRDAKDVGADDHRLRRARLSVWRMARRAARSGSAFLRARPILSSTPPPSAARAIRFIRSSASTRRAGRASTSTSWRTLILPCCANRGTRLARLSLHPAHLAHQRPFLVGHRLHRKAREFHQRHVFQLRRLLHLIQRDERFRSARPL